MRKGVQNRKSCRSAAECPTVTNTVGRPGCCPAAFMQIGLPSIKHCAAMTLVAEICSYQMRAIVLLCLAATAAVAQPQSNTATIDADGTARITRVIPVPDTISPEA